MTGRRIHWTPDEEFAAMETARYAEYCATHDDEDGTLEFRVMGPWRLRVDRVRRWWRRGSTPLNYPMWRAVRRMRKTMIRRGIDPKNPRAIYQLWGQYELTRNKD